ncbi:MAG TPA: transcription antitermination factor NusB [Thermodesulfobacteriota bacterium]|nr:transcription antitermination factor NusB [Thermodesulfobacteriota bacterium]
MASRRQSRESAIQALYQLDLNPGDFQQGLTVFEKNYPPQEEGVPFFRKLVQGVCEQKRAIDLLIRRHSQNWRLERMSPVDRNILRLAVYELRFGGDTPPKSAINEAIDLGKRYGSEESSAFINGILDSILTEIQTPVPEAGVPEKTAREGKKTPLPPSGKAKGRPRGGRA